MYRVEYSGTVWYSLVPAVVSSLQSEVCSVYTSPTSHHPTRPEDQEDGGRIINKIYISPSLSLSLPAASQPALPSLIKYLGKIGKVQVNRAEIESVRSGKFNTTCYWDL